MKNKMRHFIEPGDTLTFTLPMTMITWALIPNHFHLLLRTGAVPIATFMRQLLTGGGLIRSAGGWAAVKALKKEKVHVKSDERVSGDGDFVEKILSRSRERYERQYALKASGIDLDNVAARVAELLEMDIEQVWQPGKFQPQVQARSLLCYWAVRELGESITAMAGRLGISTPAANKAVAREAVIAEQKGYKIVPS